MIAKLYRVLLKILPYQRIPKLPRGMLSADFERYSSDDRRVLARLGARDPRGIKVAMRRAQVETVNDLVQQLEHHRPEREFKRRWNALLCRLTNATNYHPHRADIVRSGIDERRARQPRNVELSRRLDDAIKRMQEP